MRDPNHAMTLLTEHAPVTPASAGAHPDIPRVIERPFTDVLLSRGIVTTFIGEWQPMGKTACVNSDTSSRDGRAGVAYESGATGRRVELVDCVSITAGEYLALLMAMGDTNLIGLSAPMIFRIDSEAVARLKIGRTCELIESRDRIRELLVLHPHWRICQISHDSNRLADELASHPFMPIRKSEWDRTTSIKSCARSGRPFKRSIQSSIRGIVMVEDVENPVETLSPLLRIVAGPVVSRLYKVKDSKFMSRVERIGPHGAALVTCCQVLSFYAMAFLIAGDIMLVTPDAALSSFLYPASLIFAFWTGAVLIATNKAAQGFRSDGRERKDTSA